MNSEFIKKIAKIINKKIGIELNLLKEKDFARNIRERMVLCSITDPEDYFQLLTNSNYEFQEFIELVIVPETWFFRDKGSLAFFKDYVEKNYFFHPNKKLKILSIPCSSGEEPYTIAMILSDLGMDAKKYTIHAADISQKALVKAEYGIYNKNSFRGCELEFREKYFIQSNGKFTLDKNIRNQVHFFQENIKEPKIVIENQYDIIFCRNLFIYLDQESQKFVLKTLDHILDKNGVIIVGNSEGMVFQKAGYEYERLNFSKASAYGRKKVAKDISTGEKSVPTQEKSMPTQNKVIEVQSYEEPKLAASKSAEEDTTELEKACDLANKGRLEQAKEICMLHLNKRPTAQVYFLLGLIFQAQEDLNRAIDYFQKALILEPQHPESLFYLRLVLESRRQLEKKVKG